MPKHFVINTACHHVAHTLSLLDKFSSFTKSFSSSDFFFPVFYLCGSSYYYNLDHIHSHFLVNYAEGENNTQLRDRATSEPILVPLNYFKVNPPFFGDFSLPLLSTYNFLLHSCLLEAGIDLHFLPTREVYIKLVKSIIKTNDIIEEAEAQVKVKLFIRRNF